MLLDIITRLSSVAEARAFSQLNGPPPAGSVRAYASKSGWFFVYPDGSVVQDGSTRGVDTQPAEPTTNDDEFDGSAVDTGGARLPSCKLAPRAMAQTGSLSMIMDSVTVTDTAQPWVIMPPSTAGVNYSETVTGGHLVMSLGFPVAPGTFQRHMIAQQAGFGTTGGWKFRCHLAGEVAGNSHCFAGLVIGNLEYNSYIAFGRGYIDGQKRQLVYRFTPAYDEVANRGRLAQALTDEEFTAPIYVEVEALPADPTIYGVGWSSELIFRTSRCGLEGTFEEQWREYTPIFYSNEGGPYDVVGYVLQTCSQDQQAASPFTHYLASNWFRRVQTYSPSGVKGETPSPLGQVALTAECSTTLGPSYVDLHWNNLDSTTVNVMVQNSSAYADTFSNVFQVFPSNNALIQDEYATCSGSTPVIRSYAQQSFDYRIRVTYSDGTVSYSNIIHAAEVAA